MPTLDQLLDAAPDAFSDQTEHETTPAPQNRSSGKSLNQLLDEAPDAFNLPATPERTQRGVVGEAVHAAVEPFKAAARGPTLLGMDDDELYDTIVSEAGKQQRVQPAPGISGTIARTAGSIAGGVGEFAAADVVPFAGPAAAFASGGAWESTMNAGIKALQEGKSKDDVVRIARSLGKVGAVTGGASALAFGATGLIPRTASALARTVGTAGAGVVAGVGSQLAENIAERQAGLSTSPTEGLLEQAIVMGLLPVALHARDLYRQARTAKDPAIAKTIQKTADDVAEQELAKADTKELEAQTTEAGKPKFTKEEAVANAVRRRVREFNERKRAEAKAAKPTVPGTEASQQIGAGQSVVDEIRSQELFTRADVQDHFRQTGGRVPSNEEASDLLKRAWRRQPDQPGPIDQLFEEPPPAEPETPAATPGEVIQQSVEEQPLTATAPEPKTDIERRIIERHRVEAQAAFDAAVESGDKAEIRKAQKRLMQVQRVLQAPTPQAKPPILPKPPLENLPRSSAAFKPEVPTTGAEERETVLETIRKANARTKEQIRALFPNDESMTREKAAQLRDEAWGKQEQPPPKPPPEEPPAPAAEPVGKPPPKPPALPPAAAPTSARDKTKQQLGINDAEVDALINAKDLVERRSILEDALRRIGVSKRGTQAGPHNEAVESAVDEGLNYLLETLPIEEAKSEEPLAGSESSPTAAAGATPAAEPAATETPKPKETNAIQEQKSDEEVLRDEGARPGEGVGLPEVGPRDVEPEQAAAPSGAKGEEGKELLAGHTEDEWSEAALRKTPIVKRGQMASDLRKLTKHPTLTDKQGMLEVGPKKLAQIAKDIFDRRKASAAKPKPPPEPETDISKIQTLTPAIQAEGQTLTGPDHATIRKEATAKGINTVTDATEGFVDQDNNFHSRAVGARWFEAKTGKKPAKEGELHSEDLKAEGLIAESKEPPPPAPEAKREVKVPTPAAAEPITGQGRMAEAAKTPSGGQRIVNEAANKVEREIQKLKSTPITKSAKQVKDELLKRIEDAMHGAPEKPAYNAAKHGLIEISIPGDGDFKVPRNLEALGEVRDRVKRISTTPGTGRPKQAPVSKDNLTEEADKIVKAYGSVEEAYHSTKRQRAALPDNDPETPERADAADRLIEELYGRTKASELENKASQARYSAKDAKSQAEDSQKLIEKLERKKKPTQKDKDYIAELKGHIDSRNAIAADFEKNAAEFDRQAAEEKRKLESGIISAVPTGEGHTIEGARAEAEAAFGKLSDRVSFVHEPDNPSGAYTDRNKIVVNTAKVAPGTAQRVLLEEGLHGVWNEPEVQGAWKQFRDSVTEYDIAAERAKRQGLDTSRETLKEEAAISKLLNNPDSPVAQKIWNAIIAALDRLFGVKVGDNRQQLLEAANNFLTGPEGDLVRLSNLLESKTSERVKYGVHMDLSPNPESRVRDIMSQGLRSGQMNDITREGKLGYLEMPMSGSRGVKAGDIGYLVKQRGLSVKEGTKPSAVIRFTRDGQSVFDAMREQGIRYATPTTGKAPIEQYREELKKIDAKPLSLREKFGESFDVGKRLSTAKDAFGKAMDGLRSTYGWVNQKIQGIDNIDDLMRAKKDVSQATETRGYQTTKWEQAARKAVPRAADQAAIRKWVDAGGDMAKLRQGAAETKPEFRKAYEDAQNLSPENLKVAQEARKYFEEKLDEAIDAGVLEQGLTDYIHRIYESKPAQRDRAIAYVQSGILRTNPSLAKHRVFDFDWQAEKEGYRPVQSFIPAIAEYETSLSRAIAARKFVAKANELVDPDDNRPIVDIKGVGTPLFDNFAVEKPNGEQFKTTFPSREAAEEFAAKHEGSNVVELEEPKRSGTLIKPQFNPAAQNIPGTPNYRGDYVTRDYPALQRWKWVSSDAAGKPILLQGDVSIHPKYVHRFDALLEPSRVRYGKLGSVLRPALALSSAFKQTMLDLSGFHQVQIAVHAMEHKVNPFNIAKDINFEDPKQRGLVHHGVTLGGDYHYSGEGLFGQSLIRQVPILGKVAEDYHNWLFRDFIPRIKMTMALKALERNRERYPGMSEEQLYHKTAMQANSAFGGLNYTLLERSKTAQDMARLIMLAPDFLEARGRFAAEALSKGGRFGGNEQRTALLLGALTMYTAARVLNKLTDDQYHFELENAFSWVHNGQAYGLRTVQGDILHLFEKPLQFWMHRLNPVFGRTALELGTQRDEFGRKRSFPEIAWDTASNIMPISLRSSREKSLWESMANAFGITDRRWQDTDKAFSLARNWKDKHGVGERGEFIYDPDKDPLRPLKIRLSRNDDAGAAAEIKKLIEGKVYTMDRLDQYFNRYAKMNFTGSRANDKKFIADLTEDQKQTIEAAKQHKETIGKLYRKARGQYRQALANPL
jgi:hypothetical protein